MKNLFRFLFVSVVVFSFFVSCLESDYNNDNINKNIEFNLPPFVMGKTDSLKFTGLDPIALPPDIELPNTGYTFKYQYTLNDFFTEDAVDKFFFKGKKNDVKLTALLDANIEGANYIDLVVQFEILNTLNQKIDINIPETIITYSSVTNPPLPGKPMIHDSKLELVISKEKMELMKDARHMAVIFTVTTGFQTIPSKAYVQLRDITLYPGSIAIDM